MSHPIEPVTLISMPLRPLHLPESFWLTQDPLTHVRDTIGLVHAAPPAAIVIVPLSPVLAFVLPGHRAKALTLVIQPVAFVAIAFSICKLSFTVASIARPVALKVSAIVPLHGAHAASYVQEPFSFIDAFVWPFIFSKA